MLSLLKKIPSFVFNRFGNQFICSSTFSHITSDGNIKMVDIGEKISTQRRAIAEAIVKFPDSNTYQSYFNVTTKKGDARLCAKLAGILAAKVSFPIQ
jgi:molybdenum cofactor biosynthesis enzyme